MERISDNVYVAWNTRGCCSHSFVSTSEGVIMIDTPVLPSAATAWRRQIERHGPIRYIINTEPHIDHFGGSAFFSGTVVAHNEVRIRIASTSTEEMVRMLTVGGPDDLPIPGDFSFRLPEITFSENLTLYLGDHTFEILKMPGHTPCQVVVYVPEEKILFAADTVTNKKVPSLHEASPFQWLRSLERLKRLDIALVVPGHGPIGGSRLIIDMEAALREAVEVVRGAIDKGVSLGEAKNTLTLFKDWDDFLPDLRTWLNRVNVGRLYQLLKGPS